MADEAAVLEAPVEEVVTESPALGDGSAADVSERSDASTETLGAPESASAEVRGPQLWRDVKSATEKGQPLSKEQLQAVRNAIHFQENQKSKYPDGLTRHDQALEQIERFRPPDDVDRAMSADQFVEEALTEREYFRELDQLFTSASPQFVDKMADASAEAFQRIAPAMMSKYSDMNPEGFTSYFSQIVTGDMNQAELPVQFSILNAFLPQLEDSPAKQQIVAAFQKLFAWSEKYRKWATQPVQVKGSQAQPQTQGNQQTSEQRELGLTLREWNAENRQRGMDMIESEAQRLAGKTPLTPKERTKVIAKVQEEIDARLSANTKYRGAMDNYVRYGNKQAFHQRQQSEWKSLIPSATRRAYDDVVAERPKAQPKTQASTSQTRTPSGQFTPKNGGSPQFRKIAGHPKTQGMIVDQNRTTHSMLLKKQAYVRGENAPVTWG